MLLRVDNLHEKKKNITESHQGRRNFERVRAFARAIFVICTRVTTLYSCYNFALVLHENALVFSQSKAGNIFMYIVSKKMRAEKVIY